MKKCFVLLLIFLTVEGTLAAPTDNTCLPVLQDAVEEMDEFNNHLKIGINQTEKVLDRVDRALKKVDDILDRVDQVIDKTIPSIQNDIQDLTNTLKKIEKLVADRTDPGTLVGWGALSAGVIAVVGATFFWTAVFIKTRWVSKWFSGAAAIAGPSVSVVDKNAVDITVVMASSLV